MAEYVLKMRQKVGGDVLLQVPSVSIAARDDRRRVLLARHAERGEWLLPGGAIEPGETPADAAVREMWEETGLRARLTRLIGVFGGDEFIVEYRNGDRTSYVMTLFEAAVDDLAPALDRTEILEVRWASQAEARALPLAKWMPQPLAALFRHTGGGAFHEATWRPSQP